MYMQEIAYPVIVETLQGVDWFGTDLDWEILEESYYYAMHNTEYFTIVEKITNLF